MFELRAKNNYVYCGLESAGQSGHNLLTDLGDYLLSSISLADSEDPKARGCLRKEAETVVLKGVSTLANVLPSGPWRGPVRGPKWVGMRYILSGWKV